MLLCLAGILAAPFQSTADIAIQQVTQMVNVGIGVIFHARFAATGRSAGQSGGIEFRQDTDILVIRREALSLIPDIGGHGG